MSQAMGKKKKKKQKKTLKTVSGPQMSAILMNTPKIKFLGMRFLRTALKSQHSLEGVILQNR